MIDGGVGTHAVAGVVLGRRGLLRGLAKGKCGREETIAVGLLVGGSGGCSYGYRGMLYTSSATWNHVSQ